MSSESTSSSSSDNESDFAKPLYSGGRFSNPPSFTSFKFPSYWDVFKWMRTEPAAVFPDERELDRTLPVHPPEFDLKANMSATWLGHATVFVQMEKLNFITDPVFAARVSPISIAGPRRYRKPPCKAEELPQIDVGVISHNHYDHLDCNAVKVITKNNPKMTWYVPMGLKTWMHKNISRDVEVVEMTWGETHEVNHNGSKFTVLCTPAQHWSRRGTNDKDKSLWSGWAVMGSNHKFFYTGDTGFCEDEYKKLGTKYGPFQLAAIPIGCYSPRWVMQSQHINPEEAVWIHKHVKAEYSMGIHWGTYDMKSNEPYLEPRERFAEAARSILGQEMYRERNGQNQSSVFTLEHGKTWVYPSHDASNSKESH